MELTSVVGSSTSVSRLLDKIIFTVLLALIPLTAIFYGTVEPGWLAIFEIIIFALGVMWVVEGLLSHSWHVKGLPLLLPLLALVILALFQIPPLWKSAPVSADPFETRRFIFKLMALITGGELLLYYTSTAGRLRALIYVVVGTAVASAIFGILRQGMQAQGHPFILTGLEFSVGYGQFINKNHFAFMMEMALGLILGILVGGGVRRDLWAISFAAVIPIWLALILSLSRGGIFSMIGQLIFIGLLFPSVNYQGAGANSTDEMDGWFRRLSRSLWARAVLLICLLLVVAFSILHVGGDPLATSLSTVGSEIEAGQIGTSRLDIWKATGRLIKDYPVAGVGFGGYFAAIATYHQGSGVETPQEAHNDYLELLASGGIIAVALGIWFVIEFIKSARRHLRSVDPFRRAVCFGALAGIVSVAIHSIVDFGLHITVNALVFTALVVLATVNGRVEQRPGQKPGTYKGV